MPLGISERKIERAYGPMDLSGVYKPILATAQKIYADEVKRIDEAKKQLATTSAELNKLRAGVREADLGDITRMYNRWADIERQLANNPNLIRRNPDVYGELKNESNTLYGNMLGVIKESKQQSDYELSNIKLMSDPNNLNKFREDALSDYQSRVLRTPISVLRTSRDNDITTYYNPIIDASKFYENFKKDAKGSLKDRDIPGTTPDKFGQLTPTLLKAMPNQDVLFEIARSDIKTYSNNKPHILAEQQLELMPKEEKQSIIDRYNQFYESGEYQKYGLPKERVFNFSAPKINKVQEFAELMAAEQFLANKPTPQLGKPTFVSRAEELLFAASLKKKGEGQSQEPQVGKINLQPSFNIIAKGGQDGINKSIEVSDAYNSIGFADTMLPFTSAKFYKDKEQFNDAYNRLLENKSFKRALSRDQNTKEEVIEVAKEVADIMNAENIKQGFVNSDITADAVRTGKILILFRLASDGTVKPLSLNPAGKNSIKYIEPKLKLTTQPPKGKRQVAAGGLIEMSDVSEAETFGL